MSDVKNQWVLKAGHRIAFPEDNAEVAPGHYVMVLAPGEDETDAITTIQRTSFEKHFQPLDVESLTTQLEEILLGYSSHEYVRGFDAGKNWEGEDEPIPRDVQSLADAVAEVLELIGMKGKQ